MPGTVAEIPCFPRSGSMRVIQAPAGAAARSKCLKETLTYRYILPAPGPSGPCHRDESAHGGSVPCGQPADSH